ncbi:MAG: undecaprenyl/decaprenyl-phosphate alpha-N-acetylglucosaminyl 1-phosphate transferase [Flavobacteriales bacterium]|nr:undecaprenyl/decaprenyl-phosphate alpha-N-acetylglucosaminyl 1-phosphate transferase [Flavobacteriales bacterium]
MSIVFFSLFINTIFLKFATTLGIRDKEAPIIRWSSVSKPALGGISFYIAFLLSTASFSVFFEPELIFKHAGTLGLLGSTALAFLMGLADDAYDTKPLLKFGVQILCGIILISTGTVINLVDNDWIDYALTILWVIGIMNSINMLDNMDGITTSVSLAIIVICLISLSFQGGFATFDYMVMLGICAALIGFLFFNWHPSKMFMGDTGSQFIGMFLAYIGIKYLWNGTLHSGSNELTQQVVQVLIAFIIPIVDTTSVVINRVSRGQSPFVGGKDHTTHHLSYLGLTDSQVGFTFLGLSVLSMLISVGIYRFIDVWLWYHNVIFITYFLLVFVTLFFITQKNKDKRK